MFGCLAIYFIIFNYIPMAGIAMAFEKYSTTKGLFGSKWVGFDNFVKLFTGSGFTVALRNTAAMAVLNLLFGFFPPIIMAVVFSECRARGFRRFAQICSYMPNFISAVVVCTLLINFLGKDGGITLLLSSVFGTPQQNWLAIPDIPVFWIIYALLGVWIGAGYGSIVYTTSIANVNYEPESVKLIIEKAQMPCGVTTCGFYFFHPMGELLKTVKPLRYKRLNRFRQTSFTDSGLW